MRLLFTLCVLFLTQITYGQCCSGGSPVGGTTNQGTLGKGILRTILNYRTSFSNNFLEGDVKQPDFNFPDHAGYHHIGLSVGYGITHALTFETEWGYYLSRFQFYKNIPTLGDYELKGYGLTNAKFSLKYNFAHSDDEEWEVTGGAGVKVPLTPLQVVDGVVLSRDVQPSNGAFGALGQLFMYKGYLSTGWRFFLINRFEWNGTDDGGYKYGNRNVLMLFATKALNANFTAIGQIRTEWRGRDQELYGAYVGDPEGTLQDIASSGGWRFYISPQLNYTLWQKWNLSVLIDIPFYQYYNGLQLSNAYSFAVTLSRDFQLFEAEPHDDHDIPDPFD